MKGAILADQAIFLTLAGSHAHGTARTGSDLDVRGVVVAPLVQRVSLRPCFEHAEGLLPPELLQLIEPSLVRHDTARLALAPKAEFAVDELAKFLTLCAAANPGALEVLFTDERHWLFVRPAWHRLHAVRHLFLTLKVQQTFTGYAMAQLQRIKSHRVWLLDPPKAKPTRAAFGLPEHSALLDRDQRNRLEQSLADKLRSYGVDELEMPRDTRIALRERLLAFTVDALTRAPDQVESDLREVAAHALGLPKNLIEALNAEKRYQTAMRHWESFQGWKNQRNPARAALEREFGYDTKHAMHLIRLMRMGLEALQSGDLLVERPDAAELRRVREGGMSYEALAAEATALRDLMTEAATTSSLPAEVEPDALDALYFELASK